MLVSVKKIFISLLVVTALVILIVFVYSNGRTYYNDENEIGNTPGNIYNGGLFCEKDGKIYFSNDDDDGSLYAMNSDCTNVKKLRDDKAVFINADDNYLYYVRANNTREDSNAGLAMFHNTGVYRIDNNGRDLKLITGNPGSYLTLKGNFLYLQRYDAGIGLYLYRYQIDGTQERLLVKDSVIPALIGSSLYYAGYSDNHNINRLDLSSFIDSTDITGEFAYPIFMGDSIYYINIKDNYSVCRMNKDGSDPTVLINKRCSTYNITESGQYLYYQVDNKEKSKICRLDLQTMESKTLLKGDFKQIHVTENYVFFKAFDNSRTYVLSADGAADLGTFEPGNGKSK